ncbi:MAG: abortive infection family protein [Chloroflexi bacterium]|nr:abortive infection family protein [Chloroflexota bacterium]MBP7043463.1 abortive infection family protein [Chloroflexota bacterium]
MSLFDDPVDEFGELKTDYDKAEFLQNLLVARATGNSGNSWEYQELRRYFLDNSQTKDLIPRWVRVNRDLAQFWSFIQAKFGTYAERRKFIWEEFFPLLEYLESKQALPPEKSISEQLRKFDYEGVHFAWQIALERKKSDPEGAITLSKSILESVCKHILDEKAVEYDEDKTDLPQLYKLVAKELYLSPDQHSEQIFKQILGGCASVVYGLGSLRNKFGDAHGKGKLKIKPAPRHAELSVNLAGSIALFLVETFEASKYV